MAELGALERPHRGKGGNNIYIYRRALLSVGGVEVSDCIVPLYIYIYIFFFDRIFAYIDFLFTFVHQK